MASKIVFFVFDPSPRIDRRIKEFIGNGYEVEAYGFANDVNIKYVTNDVYKYNLLAEMKPGMSYIKRANNVKLLLDVIKSYDKKNTIFYFFTLNVAVATLLTPGIKYIYEESDMLFDRCGKDILKKTVIAINKRIIKKSALTVFTSEGFGEFYYGKKVLANICVVPNRVSVDCLNLPAVERTPFNPNHIRIGFVGNIRYQSILNVSKLVSEKFPQYEFHYYGNTEGLSEDQKQELKSQANVICHGLFKNPTDLPTIYSSIDVVVCTYDVKGVNPRYAEPNKLYEAIYYRTPMMVSSGSFLADKVDRLGIGFSVDADNLDDIESKIRNLTGETYSKYMASLNTIPQKTAVSINDELFARVSKL